MNKWILMAAAIAGLSLLLVAVTHRYQPNPTADVVPSAPSRSQDRGNNPSGNGPTTAPRPERPALARKGGHPSSAVESPSSAPATTTPSGTRSAGGTALFQQHIESLVSPQASFNDRQTALEQLRQAGKLDQAITDLEQRLAENPRSADTAAALGRVYLQKCGAIQDVREQGILAMKADQVFDAALNLDASNWEARFTKAVAMSYWPTQLNRGPEVIQHFSTLVEQQERQVPQPHFALSYAWLGDEYQKYGQTDQARQIWQRGATLFPDNPELAKKLARP